MCAGLIKLCTFKNAKFLLLSGIIPINMAMKKYFLVYIGITFSFFRHSDEIFICFQEIFITMPYLFICAYVCIYLWRFIHHTFIYFLFSKSYCHIIIVYNENKAYKYSLRHLEITFSIYLEYIV